MRYFANRIDIPVYKTSWLGGVSEGASKFINTFPFPGHLWWCFCLYTEAFLGFLAKMTKTIIGSITV